ncbi:murein DD-endopeptidase MepM/ murein hydrolase activator NlpD [Catenuloplanes indicus]|uniref:Murein DD-endopeptidase MepM/ murein hydrolase activator NlpD n=1 Tax=Catenuloplanes indicus TaxID=137267 RepID=A0AAE3W1H3_9ACTN|nr:M23 family metallopeptidase [Catenuloplanes indicus]MDQ0367064.1 murein DD-endopeptidase MepM/ murein hydrolase activator NlpD [Catenuloplanes indicus]
MQDGSGLRARGGRPAEHGGRHRRLPGRHRHRYYVRLAALTAGAHRRPEQKAAHLRQAAAATLAVTGLALTGGATLHDAVTGPDGAEQAVPTPAALANAEALAERAEAASAAGRSAQRTAAASPAAAPSAPTASPTPDKPSPSPSPGKSAGTATPTSRPAAKAWVDPMPEGRTTSCFGRRWGKLHAGIDLAAASGTRVRAAGAGTVVTAGANYSGYGLSVLIDHGNGFYTHYAHLSRVSVEPGDRVTPGQTVGAEGSTGNSTGPHLHFEVHDGMWNQVDPAAWMAARGVDLGC